MSEQQNPYPQQTITTQASQAPTSPETTSEWDEQTEALDLSQMDALVAEYKATRKDYEDKQAIQAEAYHKYEEAEAKVINALVASGKSKYFVDGIGTVYLTTKSSVTTPKTADEKLALFNYIKEKHGEEALTNYLSIHSKSLNSFVNKELEANPTLKIPGLSTPTVTTGLNFRKD
jgi:hypothetical protein